MSNNIQENPSFMPTLTIMDEISQDLYDEMLSMEGVTIYHTPAWHRFLTRTFGWRVRAVVVRDQGDRLVLCLPFVRKRRLGMKWVNVCLPLTDRIGAVHRKDTSLISLPHLRDKVWPIEIHEWAPIPQLSHIVQRYSHTLDLTKYDSVDDLKRSFHKSCIQQMLKKAEKSELRLIKGTERHHVDAFHELELETRHRHGIPAYPRRFFHCMWEELRKGDLIHLYLAYLDDRPVAGVIFLHFGNTAMYGYGASLNDRDVWRIGANQLTMWSAIREVYEKGMARVDFGPSRFSEPDLRTYKERWGGESRELGYAIGTDGEGHLQVKRTGKSVRAVSWILQRLPQPVYATVTPLLLRVVQ